MKSAISFYSLVLATQCLISLEKSVESGISTAYDVGDKVDSDCIMFFNENGTTRTDLLRKIHKEMDINEDNAIQFEEYYIWEVSVGSMEKMQVEWLLFKAYDGNSDGKITFDELIHAMNKSATNDDGEITLEKCLQSEDQRYKDALKEAEGSVMA